MSRVSDLESMVLSLESEVERMEVFETRCKVLKEELVWERNTSALLSRDCARLSIKEIRTAKRMRQIVSGRHSSHQVDA